MLVIEKMRAAAFSKTEQTLVDYLLNQRQNLQHKTTKQIAAETFTNPSMLIRIAKKLGFNGWTELKTAYLGEINYLDSNFESIDSNFPFNSQDSFTAIAGKLAHLNQSTISDTLSLLKYDTLKKAVNLMSKVANIIIFTKNENQLIVQDFALRMNRIQKFTTISDIDGEHIYHASSCNPDSCAIIVSYTGENHWSNQVTKILKKRNIAVIAITSIGQSHLSDHADCVLHMTTRERLYTKIASFTITTSVIYILDVLYSCIFRLDYDANLNRKIQVSKLTDHRKTTTQIMEEF